MRQNKLVWTLTTLTFIAILTLGAAGLASAAETPLPDVREYVTDTAGMLPEANRVQISQMLYNYAQDTGNQIVVVTIPTLGGEDIVSFSNRLYAQVKPGQKEKDNGAILLIARDERKMRIATGYGLEEFLPDGRCGTIIREIIRPAFKSEDYSGGILSGVAAMVKYVSPDYQLKISSESTAPVEQRHGRGNGILPFIIVIIIMIFSGWLQGGRRRRWNRGGLAGGAGPIFWGGGGGWGSGDGGGGGGFSGGGGDFGGGGDW